MTAKGFDVTSAADVDVFRSLLEHSGLCLASLDTGLEVVETNPDFAARFRKTRDGLRGTPFLDLMQPGNRGVLRQQFERLVDGRRKRFVENLPGGAGDVTGIAVPGPTGDVSLIVVVINVPEIDSPPVDGRRMLTELDARILEGIASGESAVRLASRHFLSRQGVEYHVRSMLKKLGVGNRAALVSKAYSVGVLSVASWPPKVRSDFVK
jgi:DNA-binding CsgD family transcriptional regulator